MASAKEVTDVNIVLMTAETIQYTCSFYNAILLRFQDISVNQG